MKLKSKHRSFSSLFRAMRMRKFARTGKGLDEEENAVQQRLHSMDKTKNLHTSPVAWAHHLEPIMNQTNDLNTIREKLMMCKTNQERVALICALHVGTDDKHAVIDAVTSGKGPRRRYVGNDFNGWYVYHFSCGDRCFTYSPQQGADGSGGWYVEIDKYAEHKLTEQR